MSCRRRCGRQGSPWHLLAPASKSRATPASTGSRRPDCQYRAAAPWRSSRAPGDVAANFRILQDIVRIAVGENATLVKRDHPVRVAADYLHVVFDEDEGCGIGRDGVNHAVHCRKFL